MSQHTPTPWRIVFQEQESSSDPTYEVYGDICDNIPIFDDTMYYNTAPSKADARFIVRAVNAHDKLVEALEKLKAEAAYKRDDSTRLHGVRHQAYGVFAGVAKWVDEIADEALSLACGEGE